MWADGRRGTDTKPRKGEAMRFDVTGRGQADRRGTRHNRTATGLQDTLTFSFSLDPLPIDLRPFPRA